MKFVTFWRKRFFSSPASLFFATAAVFWPPSFSHAAVLSINDSMPVTLANGLCSVPEAIHNANDDAATHADCPPGNGVDTIQLAAATIYDITGPDNITMEPTGLPLVTSEIIIEGNDSTLQRSEVLGTPLFRILLVTDTGNLTLNDLTVRNGRTGSPPNGGFFGIEVGSGIRNFGTLTLNRCTVRDNRGETWNGGGIASSGALTINDSVLIENGAGDDGGAIAISGGVLSVNNSIISDNDALDEIAGGILMNGGTATLVDTTVSRNSSAFGGGIFNEGGDLTLLNSTVSHNNTDQEFQTILGGSGIVNDGGTLLVSNSTISENSSIGSTGGGIYNRGISPATATIVNSTLSGNSATFGGGIFNADSSTLHLQNTIIANSGIGGDCVNEGTLATNLANLIEDGSCNPTISNDPLLEALANNGGPTETHALMPTSPAVDAGDNTACAALPVSSLDQRGELRPVDGNGDSILTCDIGAYEQQATIPVCNGMLATIFVNASGIIVGGPKNNRTYKGLLVGTAGNDVMLGTGSDDRINGINGDDTICGAGGNDRLNGNNGDDTMVGGGDSDRFKGGGGNDTVIDYAPSEGDTIQRVETF